MDKINKQNWWTTQGKNWWAKSIATIDGQIDE